MFKYRDNVEASARSIRPPRSVLLSMSPIKIAVPNKGRLSDSAVDLLRRAGLKLESARERQLFATALDGTVSVLFVRAQDIPEFVQDGVAHLGITGHDVIVDSAKDVDELMDLGFGYCRLVLAAPESDTIASAKGVKAGARIATSFPRATREYFKLLGNDVQVVEVSGAAEITPRIGVADYIVDLTSSGSTLKMNHMREVETLLVSTARLIANPKSLKNATQAALIRDLKYAIESVVAARGKRYLMANVPRDKLDAVRAILPGIDGPTIMEVMDGKDPSKAHDHRVAAHAVVDDAALTETVNALRKLGATGILVLPIERLMP